MNQDIVNYNQNVESSELKAICERLANIIQTSLPGSTNKVWHASPVWFINDNPIVGYSVTKKGLINVLFWSGQSFKEPGLSPEGSFKAAEVKYANLSDIDEEKLKNWLAESVVTQWNYRDIRKNRGAIELL